MCQDCAWASYEKKIEPIKSQVLPIEKTVVLKIIDQAWINHIDMMSKLKDGIHLRSYAQNNPLQAYVEEGYQMFEEMMARISKDVHRIAVLKKDNAQLEQQVEKLSNELTLLESKTK